MTDSIIVFIETRFFNRIEDCRARFLTLDPQRSTRKKKQMRRLQMAVAGKLKEKSK